jgi:hypothetical protein
VIVRRFPSGQMWRIALAVAAGGLVVLGWVVDRDSRPGSSQGSRQAYSFEHVRTVDEDAATRERLTELIRQVESDARAQGQDPGDRPGNSDD